MGILEEIAKRKAEEYGLNERRTAQLKAFMERMDSGLGESSLEWIAECALEEFLLS